MDGLQDALFAGMLRGAYALFLANFLFGILVRLRVINTSRFRFVHHLLYALVMAAILAAAVTASVRDSWQAGLWPGVMALLLLGMPAFRGLSRAHAIYATLCLVLYTGLVVGGAPFARFSATPIHAEPREPVADAMQHNAFHAYPVRRPWQASADATIQSLQQQRSTSQWNYSTPFAHAAQPIRDSSTSR